MLNRIITLVFLMLFPVAGTSSKVELVNNGYNNVVIAIHEQVPETLELIDQIKEMVTDASAVLYTATRKRAFFRDVKILIPSSWTPNSNLYKRATTQSYNQANVIVADGNYQKGDDPYTLHYGGCGQEGQYIIFTPGFLLNDSLLPGYGPRGKVFVHEWAHLRWGVFDEYDEFNPFYRGKSGLEATRCSLNLTGKYVNCNEDRSDEECAFFPETLTSVSSSLMYAQSLPSVSMFCDEASHNRYAPNKQNKKCQYRSTWEVIMESKDFNNVNPPVELSSTRPAFSLLQIHKNRFICLVLDVSGSMSGERLERLKQAATSFILDMVPLGSYVGIVTFSSSPLIKRHLTRVDEHSRQEIINDLPEHAQGGTNICSGLEEGYEVLRRDDGSVDGDEILLLTDGEDSSLSRCLEKARLSGAKIHSLALGQSADESLKKFPNVTGGRMFYASDEFRSNGLIESFLGITDESIELIAEGETLEPDDSFDGSFYIESDIAKDTTIFVTWNTDFIPKVGIYAPYSSTEYHMRDFKVDDNLQYARLHIPEPEVGQWEYLVTNTHTRRQSVTFTVTSKPSDPKAHPAIVNTYIKEMSNINHTWLIIAEVFKSFSPVLNLNVTAYVEEVNKKKIPVELQDKGTGADLVANDGVYSGFFHPKGGIGKGTYKVKVIGTNSTAQRGAAVGETALYIRGYLVNGTVHMNPPKPAVRPDIMVPVEAFSRTKPGQTFSITKQPPENSDVLPPCKINDLMAVFENQTVRLSWTAPGDDLDKGTAAEYKIKMGENVFDLRDRFESAFQVNTTHVTPSPAGTREELEHPIEGMDQMNGTIVYFAICAVDENGLMSEMSNIAQVAIIEPLVPAGPELKVLLSQDNGEDSDSDSDSNDGGLGSVSVVGIVVTTTILSVCLVLGLIGLFMHKREQGDYTLRDGPEVERVPMASNV